MGNKLVHFLAKSTKVPKMGANMDLKQYPFSLLIPDTKTEPLMAIITATCYRSRLGSMVPFMTRPLSRLFALPMMSRTFAAEHPRRSAIS